MSTIEITQDNFETTINDNSIVLLVTSIPTLVAFRDGIVVFAQPGALAAPQLEQVITGVKDLDMDAVRAEIAQREAASGSDGANEGATEPGQER